MPFLGCMQILKHFCNFLSSSAQILTTYLEMNIECPKRMEWGERQAFSSLLNQKWTSFCHKSPIHTRLICHKVSLILATPPYLSILLFKMIIMEESHLAYKDILKCNTVSVCFNNHIS